MGSLDGKVAVADRSGMSLVMRVRRTIIPDAPGERSEGGVLDHPPVVVVLGPPGAGKGTQCARLAQTMGWAHVSLGDALRVEIARGSDLGERARRFVEQGSLVPDVLAVEAAANLLALHASAPGVLFDGFPRTVGQAEAFDELAREAVRLCFVLVAPRDELVERLVARGRDDDRASVIRRRLLSYQQDTQPMIASYAERGLVRHVDARSRPALITEHLTDLIHDAIVSTRHEQGADHHDPHVEPDVVAAPGPARRDAGQVARSDAFGRPPCHRCGFVTGATPPEELVAAVMRIPGQYRAVLDSHGTLEEIDVCLRERPGPEHWSVLESLAHVADELHLAARHTVTLLDGDQRPLPARVEVPRTGSNRWPIPAVLGSLHAGASGLGRALSRSDPDEWNCSRPVGDRVITVRQLVDDALHEAAHHLVDVEISLGAICRGFGHDAVSGRGT